MNELQIQPGRYELEGSAFTMEGRSMMLREREKPNGKPSYFLMALKPSLYVSGLFPQRDGRYRFDYASRVYYVTFGDGVVTITGGEPMRRAESKAPWLGVRR